MNVNHLERLSLTVEKEFSYQQDGVNTAIYFPSKLIHENVLLRVR